MDEKLEIHYHEQHQVAGTVQAMADAHPAFGIFAAVLGAAQVRTFLGVFFAYGFCGPPATKLTAKYDTDSKYFSCMKAGILAYLGVHAPAVCVEFARKSLMSDVRPSFYEVEEAVDGLPSVG